MSRKKHEIDATNMAPGRLASQIAHLLIGKHKTSFEPHIDNGDKVIVTNVSKIAFTGKKVEQKELKHHSMHPGGLKSVPVKKLLKEKPEEVVLHAVMKMLPKNKHRDIRMQRLQFK